MKLLRLALPALVLAIAGCATPQDSAVFVTRTSLSVIDVDSAPASAAFGYNRVEGYLGPRYDSGTVPAVAGSFHTDGGLFDRKVRQTYATGNAALNATANGTANPAPEGEYFAGERKAMFFGTGTVLGVNIGFGDVGANAFTLGFKRKEISVIPVTGSVGGPPLADGSPRIGYKFPSVFARLDNTAEAGLPADSGLSIHQFFATGVAAQRLANNAEVQAQFRKEAVDPRLRYRDEEHRQARLALNALYCVSRVADTELPKVFGHAEALGLFKDRQAFADLRAAATAQAARAVYTGHMGLLDPNEQEATTLVRLHQKFVCDLPGAKT